MWRKSSYSCGGGECVEVDTSWQKSSYSGANGQCVEVGWQKSKHSANNGACVEVNRAETLVGVRDTKEAEKGDRVILGFSRAAWKEFITSIKS